SELRGELRARGHAFRSETDTEVVAHLLEEELAGAPETGEALVRAMGAVFRRLEGLNAIAVLDVRANCLASAKNGSPLVLGWGQDGHYLASDPAALLEHTRRLTFVEDDRLVLISPNEMRLFDAASGVELRPDVRELAWELDDSGLAGY